MTTTDILETIANHDADYFTTPEVVALAGCTYRQLDYWVRTDLITPCLRLTDTGSGRPRRWDVEAVLEAVVLSRLSAAGVAIERLRDTDIITLATTLIHELDDVLELARALDEDNTHHRNLLAGG